MGRIGFKDYLNEYLFGAGLFMITGLIVLLTGYGYSTFTGITFIPNRLTIFLIFAGLAVFSIALDIVYVQLKRHYKKRYRADDKPGSTLDI